MEAKKIKKLLVEVDTDIMVEFKALAARSRLSMKSLFTDLIIEANKEKIYILKNSEETAKI